MPEPLKGDPVVDIADLLRCEGVPHAFTGSLALAYWAEPRATKDIDLVITPASRVALALLLKAAAARGFEVDPEAALREIDQLGFTAIPAPVQEGGEIIVELIVPRLRALGRRSVARAVRFPFPGCAQGIPIVSAEDLLIYKVIFFRERDKLDIADLIEANPDLDRALVLRELEAIYEPDRERIRWLHGVLSRFGRPRPSSPDLFSGSVESQG